MESTISEGSRIVYFGGIEDYKGEIGTVDTISKRQNNVVVAGIRFRPNHTAFIDIEDIAEVFADSSIPNGVKLSECCVRPMSNPSRNHMPDDAIGKPFGDIRVYKQGILIPVSHKEYGDNYWLFHDTYHVVPNYKTAWVWKGDKLHREDVLFKEFNGKQLLWQSCRTGETLKDRVVKNNISEGLDFARMFIQLAPIEVQR